MKQLLIDANSPITTITGIVPILGASILGEIGDIHRFSKFSKLVAYAGLDASISQSGQYEATRGSDLYLKEEMEKRTVVCPALF